MEQIKDIFKQVRQAKGSLAFCKEEIINDTLYALADRVEAATDRILEENAKDLAAMDPSNPKYDRLKLTAERIHAIAQGIRQVATLPSPSGRILSEAVRPNGMKLTKVSVPFGVIGIIYEARPNVTLDYSPQNGVILLVMAFLISPMGLPLAAIWLLGKVQSLKFAIQDWVYG